MYKGDRLRFATSSLDALPIRRYRCPERL